jgi:RIO kinase 1
MPDSLATLVDYGIIQEVVRPLMSGKEAQIYLVISAGEERVAKVYKEAQARTFKHRAEYTEGRKTRNSRDQRAVNKRSRHGRAQDEAAWRSTEVDMIYRLRDAQVRVPEPYEFIDGVLVMELVKDAEGNPAPRLGDLAFEPAQAQDIYDLLITQVVRMLCAGVVHGDLSDFNVLMGAAGPVVIDFPQSVDPASNRNARRLLLRDVDNLHRFLARCAPHARRPLYAQEMWELYEGNRLRPTTQLRGGYRPPKEKANTDEVLALIDDAGEEERERREARGEDVEPARPKPLRAVVDLTQDAPKKRAAKKPARDESGEGERRTRGKAAGARKKSSRRRRRPASEGAKAEPAAAAASAGPAEARDKDRQRRRRRPKRSGAKRGASANAPRSESSASPRPSGERPATAKSGAGGKERDTRSTSAAGPAKKRARRRRRPASRRPSSSKA